MEPNYSLLVLFIIYRLYSDAKVDSRVKRVFDAYDFKGQSGLVQFWECGPLGDADDIGCTLKLTNLFRVSNIHDSRLKHYRMKCLNNDHRPVGRLTKVGNWFAGRAAQTGVADHRTSRVMLNQDRQYVDEASGMGQLVVPVYFNYPGAGLKLAGIIELVTTQPKESYVADFEEIQNLLTMVNLTSTYMGKTIKVQFNENMIKFTLPFSAKLQDLQKQVTMRFKELENTAFCFKYEDTDRIPHSILNDQDLECCIDESISNRTTIIRMHVSRWQGNSFVLLLLRGICQT